MRNVLAAVCLFIASMSLVSCGSSDGGVQSPNGDTGSTPNVTPTGTVKYPIDYGYRDVYEFTLNDGTRCVLAGGDGGGGGVDCDWQ